MLVAEAQEQIGDVRVAGALLRSFHTVLYCFVLFLHVYVLFSYCFVLFLHVYVLFLYCFTLSVYCFCAENDGTQSFLYRPFYTVLYCFILFCTVFTLFLC